MSKYIQFRERSIFGNPVKFLFSHHMGAMIWNIKQSKNGHIIADDNLLEGI